MRYSPTPVTVPPVPTPAMKISTLPSVCFQISGPVVALWIAGLAGLTNCPRITEPSISFRSSSALAIAPFIPLAPSVSTISAPYALRRFLLSTLIVSGSVRIALYPLAAATAASPIPVFPLVGSMIVAPGLIFPLFSASSIMLRATLSFTDPAGFKYSSFARSVAFVTPAFLLYPLSLRRGVPPISSNALSLMSAMIHFSFIFHFYFGSCLF